ncbi:MAG: thiol oxidoreductase, partial [Pseudooceanicola sp.]|nr:thiol oxidoreductase [Pseudooceanicola sp.]
MARTEAEAARVAAVTAPATDFTRAEPFEDNPGGAATVPVRATADAFSQPSANMDFERELDFRLGNGLFRKLWVSAPSSTLASDGLGP